MSWRKWKHGQEHSSLLVDFRWGDIKEQLRNQRIVCDCQKSMTFLSEGEVLCLLSTSRNCNTFNDEIEYVVEVVAEIR